VQLRSATPADIPAVTDLINRAFFKAEHFFIDGDRTTASEVEAFLKKGEFLALEDNDSLAGVVYLEVRGDRAYFGLLSIDPARQGQGLGSKLIAAAEVRATGRGCAFMDLQIINLRAELPPFYHKLGYKETGTAPFPENVPTRLPCHFVRMSKPLG
jgi:ribosomal protein S18 acetylase RimI-like enzyme